MLDLAPPLAGPARRASGLTVTRRRTAPGIDPLEGVTWNRRDVVLRDARGGELFRQDGVEAPAAWSDTAVQVVATKYFRGRLGTATREGSVRAMLVRVVGSLARWAREDGLFAGEEDDAAFADELARLLVDQAASFNSPVWFNVGVEARPQCSACFINSVDDTLESILALARTEGMLFKYGSGSGCNLSSLRGSMEPLSGGGTASGPLSFMRGLDAFAGAIKSGGKTRRAARMVLLDVEHPDVLDFVRAKLVEEAKARALVAAGYDPGFDAAGGAYGTVAFQNANHSLRVTDAFLHLVEADGEWTTRRVADGAPGPSHRARELWRALAEAAWSCGDPGVQYADAIARWHTCPAAGPIRASNPCGEFLFLDESACNLASLNLMRFWTPATGFDAAGFAHACEVLVTAQEVLVDHAGYPTPAIAETSRRFRPLGLGFANLGGLLMACGLPYDSEPARAFAAGIAALMTGAAYRQSARLAAARGPFAGHAENAAAMGGVIAAHAAAAAAVDAALLPPPLRAPVLESWSEAVALGREHGFRNAQVTCLAPTGTIALTMDCDTTGVEPELALVKRKQLVGGGSLRLVNGALPLALASLGYGEAEARALVGHAEAHGTLEGAPGLAPAHLAVFDTALPASPGGRRIAPRGHLRMLAALQPLVSGGISKTVNLPHEATVESIEEILLDGWRLGLKSLTVYRDGCKGSQPITARRDEGPVAVAPASLPAAARPARRRLPDERRALTHKFSIQGHEGYVTAGLYDDGQPGEIFLVMAKEGSTISGLMDALATVVSMALQYGVPLAALVEKLSHTRFEPSGMTKNPEIPFAKSLTDYLFRWLGSRFLPPAERAALGVIDRDRIERNGVERDGVERDGGPHPPAGPAPPAVAAFALDQRDAPACHVCGTLMTRSGTCYRCDNCGATSGCG